MVTSWIWARPWPRLVIDSLRVSVHATGRPSSLAKRPSSSSSGYGVILAPNPPPTSGVTTRTADGLEAVDLGDEVAGAVGVLRRHPHDQAIVDPRGGR